VPGDGDRGEHQSGEAEDRDVKKDMHVSFKEDSKVRGFVQLIPSMQGIWLACRGYVCISLTRRYELGTPLRERGFPP
jgi:hypothetical protein